MRVRSPRTGRARWFVGGLAVVVLAGGALLVLNCAATGAAAKGDRLVAMEASPNWRDGRFVNSLARTPIPFWKGVTTWIRGAEHTVPGVPVEVVPRRARDFVAAPASGVRVTWLGHSTTLVELDGKRILFDPVWSERGSPFTWVGPKRFHAAPLPLEELPALDAVVISHDHYDHLDHRTIIALGERVPLYVTPLGVGAHLERWGVARERIVERDWWGEARVGDVRLVATPARHFSGRSLVMANQDKTLWAGWVVAGPHHRLYYSGDTAMFPGFAEIGARLGPFDVVLIETGAYNQLWADVHLGPEQAIAARLALGSGLYIPVHWGTFDLALHAWTEPVERVLVAGAAAGVAVAVPRPGESIDPFAAPVPKRWWPSVPWKTARQTPVVSSGLR